MPMAGADAVIVVSGVDIDFPRVEVENPDTLAQTFTATVDAVLYVADRGAVSPSALEGIDLPDLVEGTSVSGFSSAVRTADGEPVDTMLADLEVAGKSLLLVLEYRGHVQGSPAVWYATPFEISNEGALGFPNEFSASERGFNGLRAAVDGGYVAPPTSAPSDTILFAQLVSDARIRYEAKIGVRELSIPTPVYDAYRGAIDGISTGVDWYEIDPNFRAIDREFTPPVAFAAYVEIPLRVIVPEAVRVDMTGLELVVRTASGVSHVAEIAAGTTIGSLFVLPGEQVTLYLADRAMVENGKPIGTITWNDLSGALGVQLTITNSMVAIFDGSAESDPSVWNVFTERADWLEAFNDLEGVIDGDAFVPKPNIADWDR